VTHESQHHFVKPDGRKETQTTSKRSVTLRAVRFKAQRLPVTRADPDFEPVLCKYSNEPKLPDFVGVASRQPLVTENPIRIQTMLLSSRPMERPADFGQLEELPKPQWADGLGPRPQGGIQSVNFRARRVTNR
jgi:hypothetical protein